MSIIYFAIGNILFPMAYGKKIHIVPKFHVHVQKLSIFVTIIHLFFKWLYMLESYNMILV
ncbi:MAG: hypothetical protein SRB1_02771 [Desulfobacteraceae bacterium Eth-SRB1]|nr:MAG: hypothetical protein SRB1_02771 [Desulfobacteraceae bacterium Eth-SRB1]